MAEPRDGFTGMVINEITFKNFGERKINGKVAFTRPYEPCFATDDFVFEALNFLLDPRYDEYREEGVGPVRDHPAVGAGFRLGNNLKNYGRDQRVIQNVKPTHTGKPPKFRGHKTWPNLMTEFQFIPNEPFMTTHRGVIDDVSERLLDDLTNAERELLLITIRAAEFRPNEEHIGVPFHRNASLADKIIYKNMHRSKVLALSPRYMSFRNEQLKIQNAFVDCPEKELHLKVREVSISKMLVEITVDQKKTFGKGMTQLKDQIEATYQFDEILFKGRIEKLFIQTKRNKQLQENTQREIQFHNNPSFMLKYKQDIEASNGWENEKINIARKKDEEYNFQLELDDEIQEKKTALKTAEEEILVFQRKLDRLVHDLTRLQRYVKDHLTALFRNIEYYSMKVFEFVKKIVHELSPVLNNSPLQVADIKNCIAGFVYHVFGSTLPPHYLFDEITCFKKRKGGLLQCFLSPLLNVLFYQTSEQAVEDQQRIMLEETHRNLQAMFSFAGGDSIELNTQPSVTNVYKLSKFRKMIGCTDALKNVLSHLFICNNEKIVGPPFCLLNLNKGIVHFDKEEKMTVTEQRNLLTSLRLVKKVYNEIAEELISFNNSFDDCKSKYKSLIDGITELYRAESEVHTEMINLQHLCYSQLNMNHTLQALIQLRLENQKRLKIYRRMLLLQDESDPDFIGTLAAQRTNVLMLEHVDAGSAINVYPVYSTNLEILRTFIEEMHNLRKLMLEALTNFHKNCDKVLTQPADGNKKQLCYYVNVDSIRFAFLTTKRKYYETKLLRRGSNVNFLNETMVQLYTNIDDLLSKTKYPMINYDTLTKFQKDLRYFSHFIRILDDMPKFCRDCLNSCQVFIQKQAEKLCEDLETFLRITTANTGTDANINVRCDLQDVDLTTKDWSRHVLKEIRKLQSVHFYFHNGTRNQYISTAFAIVVYIGYILHYTYQPIILNQLLKGIHPNVLLSICEYLFRNPPPRFTLMRVERSMLQIIQDWFRADADRPRRIRNLNIATFEPQTSGPPPATGSAPATDPNPSTDPNPGTDQARRAGTQQARRAGTQQARRAGTQQAQPSSRVRQRNISQLISLDPILELSNEDIEQEDVDGQPANQLPAHLPQASANLNLQASADLNVQSMEIDSYANSNTLISIQQPHLAPSQISQQAVQSSPSQQTAPSINESSFQPVFHSTPPRANLNLQASADLNVQSMEIDSCANSNLLISIQQPHLAPSQISQQAVQAPQSALPLLYPTPEQILADIVAALDDDMQYDEDEDENEDEANENP